MAEYWLQRLLGAQQWPMDLSIPPATLTLPVWSYQHHHQRCATVYAIAVSPHRHATTQSHVPLQVAPGRGDPRLTIVPLRLVRRTGSAQTSGISPHACGSQYLRRPREQALLPPGLQARKQALLPPGLQARTWAWLHRRLRATSAWYRRRPLGETAESARMSVHARSGRRSTPEPVRDRQAGGSSPPSPLMPFHETTGISGGREKLIFYDRRPRREGCYICDDLRHRMTQCPHRHDPDIPFVCFRCGEKGVTVATCPYRYHYWHQEKP